MVKIAEIWENTKIGSWYSKENEVHLQFIMTGDVRGDEKGLSMKKSEEGKGLFHIITFYTIYSLLTCFQHIMLIFFLLHGTEK